MRRKRSGSELLSRGMDHIDSLLPRWKRAVVDVDECLVDGVFININGVNEGVGEVLGKKEGDDSTATSYF